MRGVGAGQHLLGGCGVLDGSPQGCFCICRWEITERCILSPSAFHTRSWDANTSLVTAADEQEIAWGFITHLIWFALSMVLKSTLKGQTDAEWHYSHINTAPYISAVLCLKTEHPCSLHILLQQWKLSDLACMHLHTQTWVQWLILPQTCIILAPGIL